MVELAYGLPIGIALIFLALGVALYLKEAKSKLPRRRYHRVFLLFVIGSACCILGFTFFGPSLESRQAMVDGILRSDAKDIEEIDIQSPPHGGSVSLPVPIVVKNKSDILEIVSALNHATGMSPNHPEAVWSVWVTMKTKTKTYDFIVTCTPDNSNGTYINIMSDIDEGLEFGTFRSDELGNSLEKLAHLR